MMGKCSMPTGTLEFAGAAGGALKRGFLREILAQQGLFDCAARIRSDSRARRARFFSGPELCRCCGGAVLGAAAAFDAGIRLAGDDPREIFAGVEAEILVAGQRRDSRESAARKKDGDRAEHQMQMLGVRDQRQEDQQRQRVRPPEQLRGCAGVTHQNVARYVTISVKIKQRDDAGFEETRPATCGRTKKRRIKRPVMETATQTAKAAATVK